MKGLADKGEREEKRRNEGQKGLGDMNPLTHITITLNVSRVSCPRHSDSRRCACGLVAHVARRVALCVRLWHAR